MFRYDAVQRIELVEDAFAGLVDSLESMGRFIDESGVFPGSRFEHFVSPWIVPTRFTMILLVQPDDEGNLTAVCSIPADEPDEEVAAILEIQSVQDAVHAAMYQQRLTVSDITELPWSKEQPAVVLCRPVSGLPDSLSKKNAGTIVGIVSLPAIIEHAIESTVPMGLPTEIWDSESSQHTPSYSHHARIGVPVGAGHPLQRLVHAQIFEFVDRQWIVEVRPSAEYTVLADRSSMYFAFAGMVASIMLTLLVVALVRGKSRAEVTAAEKSLDFENFFTMSLDLFAIAGSDGVFRRLNRQWITTLGYPLEDLVGARLMDFVHPDDRQATGEALLKLSSSVADVKFMNRCLAKDGTYRTIEWCSTVGPSGNTIFAAARDITEHITMEESLRYALHEKEALIKEVHHRVKNNMQVVSSLLDLEAMHVDEPRFTAAVRESQGRIRTMAMVHEQLYRRESMSDIDLGSYLRDLVSRVVGEYRDRAVKLSIEAGVIPLDLDAAIPCGLAVNELVTNAFKYSHVDGVPAELHIRAQSGDGVCSILVEDNGPGLPEGALARSLGGTSLGLGLVSGLAAQLQGELKILPGPGACFEVRFPYPRSPV